MASCFTAIVHCQLNSELKNISAQQILSRTSQVGTSPVPPYKPLAGNVYLYDTSEVKEWMTDGYEWYCRPCTDGKTMSSGSEGVKRTDYYTHEQEGLKRIVFSLTMSTNNYVLVQYVCDQIQLSQNRKRKFKDTTTKMNDDAKNVSDKIESESEPTTNDSTLTNNHSDAHIEEMEPQENQVLVIFNGIYNYCSYTVWRCTRCTVFQVGSEYILFIYKLYYKFLWINVYGEFEYWELPVSPWAARVVGTLNWCAFLSFRALQSYFWTLRMQYYF